MLKKATALMILVLTAIFTSAYSPTQAEIKAIPVQSKMFGMKLSPDGKTAATFENGIIHDDEIFPEFLPIRLFDVETGAEKFVLSGHSDYALDVAFSPDSQTLVSYHFNGLIYVWDAATGTLIKEISTTIGGVRLEFMPDGQSVLLVLNNLSPMLLTIDIETGYITNIAMQRFESRYDFMEYQSTYSLPDYFVAFDISSDGQSVAIAKSSGIIARWELADSTETVLRGIEDEALRPYFYIRAIQFSPDETSVVYFHSEEEMIYVLDAVTGEQKAVIPASGQATSFALAPDGDTVAWLDETPAINIAHLSQPDAPPTRISLTLREGMSGRGQPTLTFTPDSSQMVLGGLINVDTAENALYVVNIQ